MFCKNCGKEVEPENEFCIYCGHSLKADNTTQNIEINEIYPNSDTGLWVFQAQRKYSMLKYVTCNIVFFSDKIVLAHLTSSLRKQKSQKASDQIKEQGLGFFKGSAEMMRYWSRFSQRYLNMGIDEILNEDPSNGVIYYQDIVKVLFKGTSETYTTADDGSSSTKAGKFQLTLNGGETIKFTHNYESNKKLKQDLIGFFGDKLKYKR